MQTIKSVGKFVKIESKNRTRQYYVLDHMSQVDGEDGFYVRHLENTDGRGPVWVRSVIPLNEVLSIAPYNGSSISSVALQMRVGSEAKFSLRTNETDFSPLKWYYIAGLTPPDALNPNGQLLVKKEKSSRVTIKIPIGLIRAESF